VDINFLTETARENLAKLGKRLRDEFNLAQEEAIILCSTQARAGRTGYCLQQAIGDHVDVLDGYPELYSDDDTCDTESALRAIMSDSDLYETIIVVTHYEMSGKLPQLVGERFGIPTFSNEARYGEGYVFDLMKKTSDLITNNHRRAARN
jgi:phosphohistidine phosphatase SixA